MSQDVTRAAGVVSGFGGGNILAGTTVWYLRVCYLDLRGQKEGGKEPVDGFPEKEME